VKMAGEKGLKLLVTLTNNWADYGGMDVYTTNLGGSFHDDFYTNPKIIAAYKNYVRAVVTRHLLDPTIFAWELANEPRCSADGTRNLPASTTCTPATLTRWIQEMSSFIKSIDPFHMVTVGDEGYLNSDSESDDWAYNGSTGDNAAYVAVKDIDFGTFHLYPDWWTKTVQWANQFVVDHGTVQKNAKKPVIMEEYGWMTDVARLSNLGTVSNTTRVEAEGLWQATALSARMPDLYWQLGVSGLSFGDSTDDGFTIFLKNVTESVPLVFEHAAKANALNH